MLHRQYRLNRERDITTVLRRGRRISGMYMTLRTIPCPHTKPRIGFIVSKKVHNKPTSRNLIKRRMRGIISAELKTLQPDYDYLFSAHPKAVGATYDALKLDMLKLLHSIRALKEGHAKKPRTPTH